MKHTRRMLAEQRRNQEVISDYRNDTLVNPLSPYTTRHDALEAATVILSDKVSNEAVALSAVLMESMGYGQDVSMESFESDPCVSLESAKVENLNAAKQEAGKFREGLLGWIQKAFTARGKLFGELDKLIAAVEAKGEGKFTLDEKVRKQYELTLGTVHGLGPALQSTLGNFQKLSDLCLTRMTASVNAMKSGAEPARAYDNILSNFGKGVRSVLPDGVNKRSSGILNSDTYTFIDGVTRIGTYVFIAFITDTDISDLSKDGKPISDPRAIAHFYEKLSSENRVFYAKILSPMPERIPDSYKELLGVLKATRALMDDVISTTRLGTLKKLTEESAAFLKGQNHPEAILFANMLIELSNLAVVKYFFEETEKVLSQKTKEIMALTAAALAITE